MNRGRNGKNDVRLFLCPGSPPKANNLIINSLWIVFYAEWHQLPTSQCACRAYKKTARDFLPLLKDKSVSIKKFQRYRKNNVSLFFCPGKNTVFQSISFLSNLEFSPPALHVTVNRIDRHSHNHKIWDINLKLIGMSPVQYRTHSK